MFRSRVGAGGSVSLLVAAAVLVAASGCVQMPTGSGVACLSPSCPCPAPLELDPVTGGDAPLNPDGIVGDPAVVLENGVYRLWYTSPILDDEAGTVVLGTAYAESNDGLLFADPAPEPGLPVRHVLAPSAGGWDSEGVETPHVVKAEGTYYLYYTGDLPPEGSNRFSIGLATSTDGLEWERVGDAPVFAPELAWELPYCAEEPCAESPGGVLEPSVLYDPEQRLFRMWYAALGSRDGDLAGFTFRIGYATSSNGMTWAREPEPVLERGERGSWDDGLVSHVGVAADPDGGYHLFYFAVSLRNIRACETGVPCAQMPGAIGHAYSADGVSFVKDENNPFLAPGNADFDGWTVGGPAPLFTQDELLVYYFGNDRRFLYTGGLGRAVFDCPGDMMIAKLSLP